MPLTHINPYVSILDLLSPTSGGNGSSGAPEKKEPSAADIKAEKAAAKAAQKAARERQQAAVEAAAAANK